MPRETLQNNIIGNVVGGMVRGAAASVASKAVTDAFGNAAPSGPTMVNATLAPERNQEDEDGLVWNRRSVPILGGSATVLEAAADPSWNRRQVSLSMGRGGFAVLETAAEVPPDQPAFYKLLSSVRLPDETWIVDTPEVGEGVTITMPPNKGNGCATGCFTACWNVIIWALFLSMVAGGAAIIGVFLLPFLGAGLFLVLTTVRACKNSTIITADNSEIKVEHVPVKLFLPTVSVQWSSIKKLCVKRNISRGKNGIVKTFSVLAIGEFRDETVIWGSLGSIERALYILQELQRVKEALEAAQSVAPLENDLL